MSLSFVNASGPMRSVLINICDSSHMESLLINIFCQKNNQRKVFMKRNMGLTCFAGIMSAVAVMGVYSADAEPVEWFSNSTSSYVIVEGTNSVYDQFAVNEFKSIVKKSTGFDFQSVKSGTPEASEGNRILIGDSPEVRSLIGDDIVSDLEPSESLITSKDNDIIIIGGGNQGTPYGVYSFLEKELGYRCFSPYSGGELIPAHKKLVFRGETYRELPAFDLLRHAYFLFLYEREIGSLYVYRNRGNLRYTCTSGDAKLQDVSNGELPLLDKGHGFNLYITTEARKNFYEWDDPKDYFASNPEFFSLDANSNRTTRLQLCFSNPELRKELTKRIIERGKRMGGRGILTLGANDWPGPLCFCPQCKALEEKYGCRGAPLYDYMLEACPEVEEKLPDIRISTLAYRKKQTEIPPEGIEKMPDNWICDFAPVDDDQGQFLDGQRNLDTLKNLKKWSEICDSITYWYYICITTAPFGPVQRLYRDMNLMIENGVRGVGVCGIGSPGMYPMQEYIMLRLMIDPKQDVWALVEEYNQHHYSDAAPEMTAYVKELDEVWLEPKRFIELSAPGSDILSFTPERIVRWQKMFDSLERKLADQPEKLSNLSFARWDVDMLTLSHYPKIIEQIPNFGINPDKIIERMRKVKLRNPWKHHKLMERAEVAYLRTKALSKPLPSPLDELPAGQVIRLPQAGGTYPFKDPDAACGEAKTQYFREGQMKERNKQIGFDFYDKATKRTLEHGTIDASKCVPGKYELYFVTKTTIPRGGFIAFDTWWGVSESLAPYYPEGDEHREFEIWASLKFVGPSFGIETDDGKDRMFCDQIFLVDKKAGVQDTQEDSKDVSDGGK